MSENKNEKDLKAELMELINGEHKQTKDNIQIAIFDNGHLKDLISCFAFLLDCLDSSDETTCISISNSFDLAILKTDIDYQVMKFLDNKNNDLGD